LFGRSLPPIEAEEFVRRVRAKLRVGKNHVALERLRAPLAGRFLIDRWQKAVDAHDERASRPPDLRNMDGEPLVLATGRRGRMKPAEPRPPTPEMQRIIREVKTKHYREWLDIPLPFLQGLTPRQAVRFRKSRPDVDVLLREIENLESRLPKGERVDITWLRRELGLDE
jgi:hypothetical protein